jgi:lipopolysaccharide export system permease protein
MINLQFFPSRQVAAYMARLFITRSFAVLFALVLVLMTLDLLGNSGDILAYQGNGDAELWRRRPPSEIAPFATHGEVSGPTRIRPSATSTHASSRSMKPAPWIQTHPA